MRNIHICQLKIKIMQKHSKCLFTPCTRRTPSELWKTAQNVMKQHVICKICNQICRICKTVCRIWYKSKCSNIMPICRICQIYKVIFNTYFACYAYAWYTKYVRHTIIFRIILHIIFFTLHITLHILHIMHISICMIYKKCTLNLFCILFYIVLCILFCTLLWRFCILGKFQCAKYAIFLKFARFFDTLNFFCPYMISRQKFKLSFNMHNMH